MNLKIKADFKAANIKESGCVMQFELAPSCLAALPQLVGFTGKTVFLEIDTWQDELPLDLETEQEDIQAEYEPMALPEAREEE